MEGAGGEEGTEDMWHESKATFGETGTDPQERVWERTNKDTANV